MDMVKGAFDKFDHLADALQSLAAGFTLPGRTGDNSLAESLIFVTDWIKSEVTEFANNALVATSQESLPVSTSWDVFTASVDSLLTDVLLAIQNLVNQVKEQRSTEGEGCPVVEGQENDGDKDEGKTSLPIGQLLLLLLYTAYIMYVV